MVNIVGYIPEAYIPYNNATATAEVDFHEDTESSEIDSLMEGKRLEYIYTTAKQTMYFCRE